MSNIISVKKYVEFGDTVYEVVHLNNRNSRTSRKYYNDIPKTVEQFISTANETNYQDSLHGKWIMYQQTI